MEKQQEGQRQSRRLKRTPLGHDKRTRQEAVGGDREVKTRREPQQRSKGETHELTSHAGEVAKPLRPPAAECRGALLVIGTYHSVMAGLLYRRHRFGLLFSIKHHVGSINAIDAGAKYMASAGTDERVFLFTNKTHSIQKQQRKQLALMQKKKLKQQMRGNTYSEAAVETSPTRASPHAGDSGKSFESPSLDSVGPRIADLGHVSPPSEVRCMKITSNSQLLLCGCADGQLITYRTRDWSISSAIPLHEKCISSVALHPAGAALAVTCSTDDRHVVVVDLLKNRLLSKWRFGTSLATAVSQESGNDGDGHTTEGEGRYEGNNAPLKRAKWERHDEPRQVKFSPSGCYFAVLSAHALLIYETATMRAVAHYSAPSPLQPQEEMHVLCFMSDGEIIIGDESGAIRRCLGPWRGVCRPEVMASRVPSGEGDSGAPHGVRQSRRHPTSHATRVKALHGAGGTLFSLDAAGVAIAWSTEGSSAELHYICSANCQGRVTTMDVMEL
uniref:Uncharacterized protein TCIL3000_8_7860 n=1 Tax=Trypanosoma congolense (strain IL3000) TaxID=1068625 RepID=G0UT43_TRYCI|nr:unnamed protein product [Trypanosoma congolense IL3000]